jgi:hypothetical protein
MLAMALVGHELEKKKIDDRIKQIRAKLGPRVKSSKAAPAEGGGRKRRKPSVAARKRIAIAQEEMG